MIDLLIASALSTQPINVLYDERGSGRKEIVIASAKPQYGIASWYGGKFHGRRTASGVRFNKWSNTCAHNQHRFGTKLRVTNLRNGRSTVCIVRDKGGFNKLGRLVDLSQGSFSKIAPLKQGLVRVKIEKIGR